MPQRQTIFISYSHKDADPWLDRLNVHLKPLVREGLIELWADTAIKPADEWRAEIASAIARARVAILLVSANFFASDFIARNELPPLLEKAKEDGLVVLPINVSASRLNREQWLARYQAVNPPSEPLNAMTEADCERIYERLAEQIEGVLVGTLDSSSGEAVDNSRGDEWAIRISLSQLHPTLLQDDKLTQQLLDEAPNNIKDDLIAPLISAIGVLTKRRRKVGVISAFSPSVVRLIPRPEDFTSALLADLIVQRDNSGHLKWFIKQTSKIVQDAKESRANVERIWRELAERYLDEKSTEYRAGLQDLLHHAIRAALRDRPNLMYPFFQLLWPSLSKWPKVIERFVGFLENMRLELGDANPTLLERLIVLQGQGERLTKPSDSRHSQSKLLDISAGGCCDYQFEAMQTPLTNGQYAFLCGAGQLEVKRVYEPHMLGPWEWVGTSGQEHRYPQVAAEIRAILENCEHTAHRPGYRWRVPTVAEWLRLAGCEDQPYPWGEADPRPDQANLSFESVGRRIKPVGTHPKGRSKFGADDCCGNIHELAWASKRERLPEDSRLMGGCYLTRPERTHSSCRRIRLLSKREPDPRRNVGLRLVRVPDGADRWTSLQKVLRELEVGTDDD